MSKYAQTADRGRQVAIQNLFLFDLFVFVTPSTVDLLASQTELELLYVAFDPNPAVRVRFRRSLPAQ